MYTSYKYITFYASTILTYKSRFCYYYILSLAFINVVHFFVQLEQYHNGDLVRSLNYFWLNLNNGPISDIWRRQYEKHGSCFFQTQVEYFESTVVMMRQIPDLPQKLENEGYILYFYII